MEVVNQDKVFAEFYDSKGNQIEWDSELVFEIKMNQFKLKKIKNAIQQRIKLMAGERQKSRFLLRS